MTTVRLDIAQSRPVIALLPWIDRALELLWLLAVVLVPLAFLDRDRVFSEAVIAYVEVPKIALLRTLVGLMAILWLVRWAIRGRLPFDSVTRDQGVKSRIQIWWAALGGWLRERPARWMFIAVGFYLATTLLSTILSASFDVSVWGEVPGQDGYPAHTVVAYIVLFGVIATHLKTRPQLWRLLGAIVVMGVLVSGYAVLQHYGHDFLDLTETSGGGRDRVTSTMGNAIFSGAVMMMVIPISLVLATITPWKPGGAERGLAKRAVLGTMTFLLGGLWVSALGVQLLGIGFTFSRGPWIGALVATAGFLLLTTVFVGWRAILRASLAIAITAALSLALLQSLQSVSVFGPERWLGAIFALLGLLGLAMFYAGQPLLERAVRLAQHVRLSPVKLFGNRSPLGRSVLALGLAVPVVAAVVLLSVLSKGVASDETAIASSSTVEINSNSLEIGARLSSIGREVAGGAFGGRTEYWKGSWRLIRDRPWFEFDSLSLPWLRPLVGYGPDLFRYIYLLESPPKGFHLLPEEPDHAHNYFINQGVEQGLLGLLSALGIFAAVFLVGGYQLLWKSQGYSTAHKLVLVALLAIFAGRFVEQMVGLARVSDLTIFWALLAVFTALPAVFQANNPEEAGRHRPRLPRTQPLGGRRRASPQGGNIYHWRLFVRLAIVAWLIGGITVLVWVKNVNYVRASAEVGEGVEYFRRGDFQSALAALDHAIDLAPDVSPYYNYRAQVYLAYQSYDNIPPESECSRQNSMSYELCLHVQAFNSNLKGDEKRPFYYRSKLALAKSAFNLNQGQLAVQWFQESLALVPNSWAIYNALAEAYLQAGQPREALRTLEKSLEITRDMDRASRSRFDSYMLQELAYRDMGELEKAAESAVLGLKPAAEIQAKGRPDVAAESYFRLSLAYRDLGELENFERSLQKSVGLDPLGKYALKAYGILAGLAHDKGHSKLEAEYRYQLAEIYYIQLGEPETAVEELEFIIKLDGSSASVIKAHRLLADIYHEADQPELEARSYFLLGMAYREQGELTSVKALQKSVGLDPFGEYAPQAYEILATSAQKRGHLELAAEYNYRLGLMQRGDHKDLENAALALYHYRLGKVYSRLGEPERAIEELEWTVKLDGSSASVIRAHRILADLYHEAGQPELEARSYFLLGMAYREQGELTSVKALQKSVGLDPFGEYAAQAYEILATSAPNVELAAEYNYRLGLMQRGDHNDLENAALALYHYRLGEVYSRLGEPQRAIEEFEWTVKLDGSTASIIRTHNILADLYIAKDQSALAAKSLYLVGMAYRGTGDVLRSVEALQKSLGLDPFGEYATQVYELLATLAQERGDPELAAEYNYRLGTIYRDRSELEKAAQVFKQILELPGAGDIVSETHRSLVEVYQELGQPEQAVLQILAGLAHDEGRDMLEAKYRYQLAEIYRKYLDEPVRAVEELKTSIKLDGSVESMARAHISLADLYNKAGQPEKTYQILAGLAHDNGQFKLEAEYRYQLAEVYRLQLGEPFFERAVEELKISIKLDGSTASLIRAHNSLADLYDKADQPELEATSYFLLGMIYRELPKYGCCWEDALQTSVGLDPFGEYAAQAYEILAPSAQERGHPTLAAEYYYRLGSIYRDRGDLEKAAQVFKQILELPGAGDIVSKTHRSLAEVYASMGQADLADKHRQLSR